MPYKRFEILIGLDEVCPVSITFTVFFATITLLTLKHVAFVCIRGGHGQISKEFPLIFTNCNVFVFPTLLRIGLPAPALAW